MAKLLKSVLRWGLGATAYSAATSLDQTPAFVPPTSAVGLGLILGGELSGGIPSPPPHGTGLIVPCEQSLELLECPQGVRGLVRAGIKGALVCASIYVCYKTTKWIILRRKVARRKERADYIHSLGCEVLQFMEDEAKNEVTDFFYEEPVLPEGLISEAERGGRTRRRHKSAPFLAKITHLAKNHFGGVPEPTKANQMAVTRMVYELCKEHNCLPHQTRHIISVVVPLVLTPDQFDISSRALLNGDELSENRAIYSSGATIAGWMTNLLQRPLCSTAWRRAMDVLVGLPDWQAFRLVH
nr:MAG: hypothetical protein 1 [Gammacarmovirus sp.]